MNDFLTLYKNHVKGIKQGSDPNQFIGLCPWHEDKTESFAFNTESGLYHCFAGCESGNAYQFAERVGIDPKPYSNGTVKTSNKKPYLVSKKKRNGGKGEMREPFLSGINKKRAYSYFKHLLENFDELTKELPWTVEAIKKTFTGYDPETKRFTFPHINQNGKAINIKWHKSLTGEQPYSIKGHGHCRLYPLNLLKEYKTETPLIICEGEKDVITLLSHGLHAATSTTGADSRPKDLTPLKRFNRIYLLLDNDKPGKTGSIKLARTLKKQSPESRIIISKWEDKPEKWDISDHFQQKKDINDLLDNFDKILSSGKEFELPKPKDYQLFDGVKMNWKRLTPTTAGYLDLASETSDVPDEFILIALLTHWAGLVGSKIKLITGRGNLRPNYWTVLFAKSSEIRKSTAFNVGGKPFKNIQEEFDKGYDHEITQHESDLREWENLPKDEKRDTPKPEKPSHVKLMLDVDFSDAGFYEMMKNNPVGGVIRTTEYADFHKKLKRDYTNQSNAFLSAYDNDRMSRITRQHGTEIIQEPAFSILGATTTGNFRKEFTATEAENGFLQRIFPVVLLERTKKRDLFLEGKPMSEDSLKLFEDMAMNWFRHDGDIVAVLTDEVKELFNKWEENFINESKEKHGTDISPNLERMIPGCLKLAMILESMEKENPPEKLIISKKSLACSQMIIENFFLPSLVYLLENEIIFDKNIYDEKQVEKAIKEAGGKLDRTRLSRKMRLMKPYQLDEIIDSLIEKDMIESNKEQIKREQGGGRNKEVYQWID